MPRLGFVFCLFMLLVRFGYLRTMPLAFLVNLHCSGGGPLVPHLFESIYYTLPGQADFMVFRHLIE